MDPARATSAADEVLPRGRHAAPRSVVQASQRHRLLDAMAEAVAEKGFLAVRVADVIARAGVSRKTFYEQFSDREECFLAAFDDAVTDVIAAIGEAMRTAGSEPLAAAKAGTRCYLEWLASNPAYARTFVVEVLAAGPEALRSRAAVRERFAELIAAGYEAARRAGLDRPERPHHVFRATIGAIDELVSSHLLDHGAEGFSELLDTVLDVEFGLLLGPGRPPGGW